MWRFLRKLKMELLFVPVIPLRGIDPKGLVSIQQTPIHPVLIMALFTVVKVWEQLRCPTVDE